MQIFCIFETEKQSLFSVKYKNSEFDAWDEIFEKWTDVEYLEEYFESYSDTLKSGFWKDISVEDAVLKTLRDAQLLEKAILTCANDNDLLKKFFKPLTDSEIQKDNLLKTKAYGIVTKWLRIYAVKLTDETYVVSGGAIKLFGKMQEQKETEFELKKLIMLKDFLIANHVFDKENLSE